MKRKTWLLAGIGGLLACGLARAETPVTDAGMRAVFGDASAIVATAAVAPEVDGRLDDAAWKQAVALPLSYADQRVAGEPINACWVRVVAHGDSLYVAMHGEGLPPKRGQLSRPLQPGEPNFFNWHWMGVVWKAGDTTRRVLVNLAGETDLARRPAGQAWESGWAPSGVVVKAAAADPAWNAEFRLPLALFQDADGRVPPLLRVDFVRRYWFGRWLTGQAGWEFKENRSLQAWAARPPEAVDRLARWDLGADADFGVLGLSNAVTALPEATQQQLRAASQQAQAAASRLAEERQTRAPGFEFSAAELAAAYPGAPVLLVPRVEKPPAVDGDPRDPAWQQVQPVRMGFLSETIRGGAVRNPAFVRAVSDSEKLYVLIECLEEQPEAIRATPKEGDLWTQDTCNVLLDAGRQLDVARDQYADILLNAVGRTEFARRRRDGAWDARGLQAAARILPAEKKWVAEVAVAFADLGLSPTNLPKVWGANFLRTRTVGRGPWINRSDTQDLAYYNFDYAWRGNIDGSAHRPDRFGVLYLQAGCALPPELWQRLATRDGAAAAAKLARWQPPETPLAMGTAPAPSGAPPAFARPPSAEAAADGARITFAAGGACDAAVGVYNAAGACVRHLAAGLLGTNAPAPLARGTLQQSLAWDFTDDLGRRVPPGEYQVRVGLGAGVRFERHLLFNPNGLRDVRGIATDAKGNLYVTQQDRRGSQCSTLLVFTRDGRYLRQLVPYAGTLPPERLAGAARVTLPDGRSVPPLYDAFSEYFAEGIGTFPRQRFAVAASGAVWLLNGLDSTETLFPKRLLRIEPDGGLLPGYRGPVLGFYARMGGDAVVALSPDSRLAYVTGLRGGLGAHEGISFPHHVVYRFDLERGEPVPVGAPDAFAPPFLGEFRVPGRDAAHFNDPRGVAVDGEGNLYVADSGNNRIAVFQPDGRPLGTLAVTRPEQVEVHPKSGAIYVIAQEKETTRLVKFADRKAAAPAYTLDVKPRVWARLALDASDAVPRLWVAGTRTTENANAGAQDVQAIDDDGAGFELRDAPVALAGYDVLERRSGLPTILESRVDYDGRKVSVWGIAYDCDTGRAAGTGHVPRRRGLDGRLYTSQSVDRTNETQPYEIRRFMADGVEDPFPGTPEGAIRPKPGTIDFDVDTRGRVHLLRRQGVDVYGADGRLEKKDFIVVPEVPGWSGGVYGSVRLQRDGSVLLDTGLTPAGVRMPRELEGRLPATDARPSLAFVYEHLYGSVVQFGPEGGAVTLDPAGDSTWHLYNSGLARCRLQGVQWSHFGMSPVRYRLVEHLHCTCEMTRFDVDDFGRVFLPDALRYNVEVLDRAGNALFRFGRYGNMDDDVPVCANPREPAFNWPTAVDVRGDRVFVADRLSKRLVKARLVYAAEAQARVTVP